jgi:3-oxoacyl-[acyl-carrier protein] reductase
MSTLRRQLAHHTALVTGVGRYQGIGAAICRALAQEGANVFFTYWHEYDAKLFPSNNQINPTTFAAELERYAIKAAFAEVDLSSTGSATRLFDEVKQRLGSPTILINNACYDIETPFIELDEEVLDKHYAVNVRATTILCKEFVKNGQPGCIVNLTSGQSTGPMGGDKIPYTITKASVEMLTKQLAPELVSKDITITALDPGPTDTGWMSEELKAQIVQESRHGRVNVPDDVAALVVELLAAKQSNGQVIHAER